jgi:hypothetical protein
MMHYKRPSKMNQESLIKQVEALAARVAHLEEKYGDESPRLSAKDKVRRFRQTGDRSIFREEVA